MDGNTQPKYRRFSNSINNVCEQTSESQNLEIEEI